MEYRPAWLGLRRDAFTCDGRQVTLCDPIWQVTLRSSVMGVQSIKSYTHLYLLIFLPFDCCYIKAMTHRPVFQRLFPASVSWALGFISHSDAGLLTVMHAVGYSC